MCVAVAIAQAVLAVIIPKGKENIEPVLGPRAGDIKEPPFLFNLFGVPGSKIRW